MPEPIKLPKLITIHCGMGQYEIGAWGNDAYFTQDQAHEIIRRIEGPKTQAEVAKELANAYLGDAVRQYLECKDLGLMTPELEAEKLLDYVRRAWANVLELRK